MSSFVIVTSITGCILIVMSIITLLYPPDKINKVYGYRTKASMRNQQTWEEANRYSSKLMLLCGGILIVLGLLSWLVHSPGEINIIIGIACTLFFSLLPIPLTERYLTKTFDKEGNRKIK